MMVATAATLTPAGPLRAYRIVCRWRFLQVRQELPVIAIAQLFFATGTAVGLGFLIPDVDPAAAAYLATGAFLINLLIIAIAVVPGATTESKTTGAFDYLWALPMPRMVSLFADLTVWGAAMLPGMVVSLVVTSIRFDFALRVSPLIVPTVALILVSASALGYAIGLRSPSAQVTNLFTNLVLVTVLLFSPVNFPAERLPGWLQGVHDVLPIASMADLVRGTLVAGTEPAVVRDLVVMGIWAVAGGLVTWRSVKRRP